jgi:HSP20 family molecular chaperone IbpA
MVKNEELDIIDLLTEEVADLAGLDDDLGTEVVEEEVVVAEPVQKEVIEETPVEEVELDGAVKIPSNMYETKEKLILDIMLPGINGNDLDVAVKNNNTLVVKGTMPELISDKKRKDILNLYIEEIYDGTFARTFALPVEVENDQEEITAQLKNGILTITMTKVAKTDERKINVVTV